MKKSYILVKKDLYLYIKTIYSLRIIYIDIYIVIDIYRKIDKYLDSWMDRYIDR